MFINGNERTPTATAAHAATFPNETHLDWNGTPLNAGTSCDAEYFAFYYCGQDLTSDQIAAIEAALEADYFTFDDRDIVCEGDSLTYGSGTALPGDTGTDPYPSQLKVLLDADTPYTWHKRNVGVSAQQLGNEIIAAEKGEVLAYRDDWRQTRVVIWAGTNDVAVASGASSSARVDPILAVMTTYVQALTANHFDPIWIKVPNMLPRSDVDVTNANFETDRLYWNSHLAAAVGANGTVIDLASNANLDDEDDTTYYSGDHVHLNATGYGVVADILATAIEADL
jgi:lysophospholipase L1-like esterase